MPIDPNLDFDFSPADKLAFTATLDAALVIFNNPSVPYVNLTKDERKATASIEAQRMPYVHNAINNILPAFPGLASPSIPLARATTLFDLMIYIQSVSPKMAELLDRLTDLSINAESLMYQSMNDSYDTAKRQEGRMEGADVFIEAIAPLFAAQGNNNEEPTPEP
jgi:hypothetical protein